MRSAAIVLAAVVLLAAAAFGWLWHRAYGPWPQWEAYATAFVQEDGRVVDRTADSRSTSEGQAYSLFFALVANDRVRFDRILRWTRNNLCEGDFAKRLPAWLWGRKSDGSWGVIDDNAASDADLWLAYTLLEAGKHWADPGLSELGRVVLWQVKQQEIAAVPGAGALLLPAPRGFQQEDGSFRLNPSYYPRFQFEYLAAADAEGPWREVWNNYERLLPALYARGLAPDWFAVDLQGRPQPDPKTQSVGSYDAIRVYLWAGISAEWDRAGVQRLGGFAAAIAQRGTPPEVIDAASGAVSGGEPIGFSGAVLPYLKALGEDTQAEHQERRLRESRVGGLLGNPAHYYDQVLALFGEGWASRRFRLDSNGGLKLRWKNLCCAL